jgi:hypothetical protein
MSIEAAMPPKAPGMGQLEGDAPQQEPIPLRMEYGRTDGRVLRQVKRTAKAALYGLYRGAVCHSWEVFPVSVQKAGIIFGKYDPARELFPKDNDFGKYAVSCGSLQRAERYFELFEQGKSVKEAKEVLR